MASETIWLVGGKYHMHIPFQVGADHTTFSVNVLRRAANSWESPYYSADVYEVIRFPSGDIFGFLQEKK
jgi:hypothetical protein